MAEASGSWAGPLCTAGLLRLHADPTTVITAFVLPVGGCGHVSEGIWQMGATSQCPRLWSPYAWLPLRLPAARDAAHNVAS